MKSGALANVRIGVEKLICVEKFSKVPQLGRFTLRNEGCTIAIGDRPLRQPWPQICTSKGIACRPPWLAQSIH